MDWERFCTTQNIEYEKTGASLARGYINVHCPFCGEADRGYHLGLHKSGRWSCYRNPTSHRGSDPIRIIMRLIGCSYEIASSYLTEENVELSDFEEAAAEFISGGVKSDNPKTLVLPTDFRKLLSGVGRARLYWRYLHSRGYAVNELRQLVRRYRIRYCDKGEWHGRVIFPITIDGQLVSWTGRTVYETEKLRYKTLSHRKQDDPKRPRALVNTKSVLFNYDNAMKRRRKVCVLVEGPLDAIRIDFYGFNQGITSVATLGTGISIDQLEMLDLVNDNCDTLVSCGDQGAEGNIMDLQAATSDLGIQNVPLPHNVGDPAELSASKIVTLFSNLH